MATKKQTTAIEWVLNSNGTAGYARNLWIGCSKISPACDNCYAEISRVSTCLGVKWGDDKPRKKCSPYKKLTAINKKADKQGIRIRVFINPDSDILDNKAPQSWRDEFWAFVETTPCIDYILVTKRIGNAKRMIPQSWLDNGYSANVWQLITVCNQEEADRDISKLLELDVSVRGLSIEPMLNEIDLRKWINPFTCSSCGYHGHDQEVSEEEQCEKCGNFYPANGENNGECPECGGSIDLCCPNCGCGDWSRDYGYKFRPNRAECNYIDWVIVGGESGKNARPMHPDWVRKIRDQCVDAGVPFFFKQWGELIHVNQIGYQELDKLPAKLIMRCGETGDIFYKIGTKRTGNILDGQVWQQMPEVKL